MRIITGTWPFANGSLTLKLDRYALIQGTVNNAPRVYVFALDSNGSLPPDAEIWGNDELMFEGTQYTAILKDSTGALQTLQTTAICGPSPVNLNSLIFFQGVTA